MSRAQRTLSVNDVSLSPSVGSTSTTSTTSTGSVVSSVSSAFVAGTTFLAFKPMLCTIFSTEWGCALDQTPTSHRWRRYSINVVTNGLRRNKSEFCLCARKTSDPFRSRRMSFFSLGESRRVEG